MFVRLHSSAPLAGRLVVFLLAYRPPKEPPVRSFYYYCNFGVIISIVALKYIRQFYAKDRPFPPEKWAKQFDEEGLDSVR